MHGLFGPESLAGRTSPILVPIAHAHSCSPHNYGYVTAVSETRDLIIASRDPLTGTPDIVTGLDRDYTAYAIRPSPYRFDILFYGQTCV